MLTQILHDKMMQMVDKAGRDGLSSNVPFKEEQFAELVKLRQLSILQAAYQPHANEKNLPILSREGFTKDLVDIAYSYAGINKYRQKKHTYEYFRDNIMIYDSNNIHFNIPHIDPENMLHAFSAERIYNQRNYKIEGMGTFEIFRDVKKRHMEKEAFEQQHQAFQNDLARLGLQTTESIQLLNPQIMELLQMQNKLIEQALEQQKLSLLQANPELMKQINFSGGSKQVVRERPQIDTTLQLMIEDKLNDRRRA